MVAGLATLLRYCRSVMFRKRESSPKQSHAFHVARLGSFQPFVLMCAVGENRVLHKDAWLMYTCGLISKINRRFSHITREPLTYIILGIFRLRRGCGGKSTTSHCGDTGSILGQCMWGLRCIEWQWDRLSPST
jgi:hypothetical protein